MLQADESEVRRLWEEEELLVGRVISLDGRRFRVLGCDPCSVRPGRVYLEELASGRPHALIVRDELA